MKPIRAIVIGYGDRGSIYASYALLEPQKLQIVGVVDVNPYRLKVAQKDFNLDDKYLFKDIKECLDSKISVDLFINATMDENHYEVLKTIIPLGKPILTEKPIVNNKQQLLELEDLANKWNTPIFVGHVLRYTPFYRTIKELILNGEIGEIRTMELAEHVGSAHYAGSYIRGRWRSEEACGSSLLLAKSCHDIDIMCWLNNNTVPELVSSFGGRYFFIEENAPKGATEFCYNCPLEKDCYYSAIKLYYESNYSAEQTYVQLNKEVVTDEDKLNFLKTNNFGRCVFKIKESNVCDRQNVIVSFKNGSVGEFTLVGGCPEANRTISIIGTNGEIEGKAEQGIIYLKKNKFNDTNPIVETIDVNKEIFVKDGKGSGHHGGDYEIMNSIISYLNGDHNIVTITKLEDSINGHLVVYAADKSRLEGKTEKIR